MWKLKKKTGIQNQIGPKRSGNDLSNIITIK